jgi:hypothetical protein
VGETFIAATLTEQFPFVGTVLQREKIEREARERGVSRARVIRDALDHYFTCEGSGSVETMMGVELAG